MKSLLLAITVVSLPVASAAQQPRATGPAGTWEIDDTAWSITLELANGALVGKVKQGAQENQIYDGTVAGDTVTFKVKSPDGDRTITFVGTLAGDVMTFTRQVEIREGGVPGGAGIYGANGPPTFTARRASGETWAGTVRNAPNPRNPNPNPNIRQVTLATRKMPDPHWRWRGGEKELTVRTFNLPNQFFPLNAFELAGDRLSYSYSRPGPGDEVTCRLARQPEGAFAGQCRAETGNVLFLIELTPPTPAPGRD